MKYNEVIQSIANRLSQTFCEVYHSAEIIKIFDNGQITEQFPAIDRGKEWITLAPTDVKDTIYIRRNGDDSYSEEVKMGSCMKAFKMRTPLRIVYFNINGNTERSLFNLMQGVLTQSVRISGIVRDKFKLLREESSGEYNFKPTTVYVAVDVYAIWDLFPDNCEKDFCIELPNPIQKCEPIIAQST
jgi:hypothetical protein